MTTRGNTTGTFRVYYKIDGYTKNKNHHTTFIRKQDEQLGLEEKATKAAHTAANKIHDATPEEITITLIDWLHNGVGDRDTPFV